MPSVSAMVTCFISPEFLSNASIACGINNLSHKQLRTLYIVNYMYTVYTHTCTLHHIHVHVVSCHDCVLPYSETQQQINPSEET